jgi:tetratricopeptide (TPR) repeat protein
MTEIPAAAILEREVLDLLASLVDKSLVVYEEDSPDRGRYRLSETLRDYARERLDVSGEATRVAGLHHAYFLAFGEEAESHLIGASQAEWLDRLEADHDNLRVALHRPIAESPESDAAIRLAGAIWRFWFLRRYQTEGRRNLQEAIERAPENASRTDRAKALNGAGNLAWSQGDYAKANALLLESLAIRQELADGGAIASSLNNLGNVAFSQGDYDAALPLYQESLSIQRELDDKRGIAMATGNLGRLAEAQSRYVDAKRLYEESLAIYRELEELRGISLALGNIANVALAEGDIEAARSLQEDSLSIRREIGNQWGIAASLKSLGDVAIKEGDISTAQSHFSESLKLRQEIGDKNGIAESLETIASLCWRLSNPKKAVTLWSAAERLREGTGAPHTPKEREAYESTIASARAAINKQAFENAWQKGRDTTLDHAIEYALKTKHDSDEHVA